jgi:hypothetical protein
MKKLFFGLIVALTLFAHSFSETMSGGKYPRAIDLIKAGSPGTSVPRPFAFDETTAGTNRFPLFLSYFKSTYEPLAKQGYVLQSTEEDWKDPLSQNYASAINMFLDLNTRDYEDVKDETELTTLDGRRVKVDRIFTNDPEAIFVEGERIPLSSLTPESRSLALEVIGNVMFSRTVRISVDRGYSEVDEWMPFGEEGSGFDIEHDSYAFVVEIDNTSDVPLDNLILEYQIFFRQSLAGTPKDVNDYYRHVGYIPLDELLSQPLQFDLKRSLDRDVTEAFPERRLSDHEVALRKKLGIFTITPPPLSSGNYQDRRRGFILSDGTFVRPIYSSPFPYNFNQDYDSRMLGIWIRLHRITPHGYVKIEYKDDVYPNKAQWDGVRSRIGQF